MVFKDHDQPLRIRVGQGTEQDGIDETEDGCVGPDAEREGQYGHDGKTGALGENPHSMAQVNHASFRRPATEDWAKHQNPNTKLQRISKLQTPNGAATLRHWSLEFGASLVFGA